MQRRPLVIVLAGPTAIGKTAAAIRLAQRLNTEIISADSRQFFREMNIGTAKPSVEERRAVLHHFVDVRSIHEPYSAGDFERDALTFLNRYFCSRSTVIMTGGSGLYLNAVTRGFDDLPSDLTIREALNLELREKGLSTLQNELHERDPEHFARIDLNNPQRLIRALEVCRITSGTFSALRQDATNERNFRVLWVGLTAPREVIYERINQRVDAMVAEGLVEEAQHLYPFRHLNALNTVGYKELFAHFDGACSLGHAIEHIKQNTRNFAKRQLTWFRKQNDITWFDYLHGDALIDFVVEQSAQSSGF